MGKVIQWTEEIPETTVWSSFTSWCEGQAVELLMSHFLTAKVNGLRLTRLQINDQAGYG